MVGAGARRIHQRLPIIGWKRAQGEHRYLHNWRNMGGMRPVLPTMVDCLDALGLVMPDETLVACTMPGWQFDTPVADADALLALALEEERKRAAEREIT